MKVNMNGQQNFDCYANNSYNDDYLDDLGGDERAPEPEPDAIVIRNDTTSITAFMTDYVDYVEYV